MPEWLSEPSFQAKGAIGEITLSLREQGKHKRRQQIFNAAIALLREQGAAGLTVAGLARRAEVSVATLYNLIGSMAEIIDCVAEQLFADYQQFLPAEPEQNPPLQDLLIMVRASRQHIESDLPLYRELILAVQRLHWAEGGRGGAAVMVEQGRWVRSRLLLGQERGFLASGLNASLLSRQIFSGHAMLIQQWLSGALALHQLEAQASLHIAPLLLAWASEPYAGRLKNHIHQLSHTLGQSSREAPGAREPSSL